MLPYQRIAVAKSCTSISDNVVAKRHEACLVAESVTSVCDQLVVQRVHSGGVGFGGVAPGDVVFAVAAANARTLTAGIGCPALASTIEFAYTFDDPDTPL